MKSIIRELAKSVRPLLVALVAPILSCGAIVSFASSEWCPAFAQETDAPGALRNLMDALPVVRSDSLMELRSDTPRAENGQVVSRLESIFAYELRLQNLENNSACRAPLVVGLATQSMINNYIHTKMGGRALGPRGFVSHVDGFLGDDSAYDWYVAAHEFEHVIMARLKATHPALPTYLVEGIACAVGIHCVRATGIGSAALTTQARRLTPLTGEYARQLFSNFATAADLSRSRSEGRLLVDELLSGLFVEFLATRKSSSPEAFFRNWAKFAAELGAGAPLESCFARNFGIALSAAETEFVSFIQDTESDPQRRFSGTDYQGYH